MSGEEWISAKEAFQRLKDQSDNPRQLLIRKAIEGSARTRAMSITGDGQQVERPPFTRRDTRELAPPFWENVSKIGWQEWGFGSFGFDADAPTNVFGSGETLKWSANGVEFNWADFSTQIGTLADSTTSNRGRLPSSAKPNDKKYEEGAHKAAQIIREKGISREKAITQVVEGMPQDIMRMRTSVIRAIRHSLDLMYRPDGFPHQN